jgi:hypothetical protein
MHLIEFGPPHQIPEEILMQHFIYGLKLESAHFLNVSSERSVMYKTVAEVRTLLKKVLNSTEYTGIYDDPPEIVERPYETQQLQVLSAASSVPPPYIEEITEPPKSSDQEPLHEFIPNLFTEEEYLELGNVSGMPKEHKCVCLRSEAFIPEAASQIEGLSAIISKEWIEEAEASSSIIQIYRRPRILLCSIGDAVPQETFYDPRVGVNVMSKTLENHIASEEPLTFSHKQLKWINGQIVESQGILQVLLVKMSTNKVFLDF